MTENYEYLNESSIDDNLICSICNDPFEEPYVTLCDHTFCYKCIEQQIQINKSCPICRHRILTIDNLTPVKTRLILNMLDCLLVKCKLCKKKGIERGNFEDHLKICRKGKKCSCSASDIQCPWIGRSDQLSSHIKQCPYEQIRPVLTEILSKNHQLEQKLRQTIDQYENEMKNLLIMKDLQRENQRLKEYINHLQQFENEKLYHLKNKSSSSNQIHSITRPITFEPLLQQNKLGSVPNGYAGLNWFNVRYTNEENARAIRPPKNLDRLSIFSHGCSCIIYNDWKNPIVISSIKRTFTLHACEIMFVNHLEDSCKLNIIARKDKKPIYSKTTLLKYNVSKIIEFQSWNNIDEIEFSTMNNYFIMTWIQLGD